MSFLPREHEGDVAAGVDKFLAAADFEKSAVALLRAAKRLSALDPEIGWLKRQELADALLSMPENLEAIAERWGV